jgi:PAS domain-containing protein
MEGSQKPLELILARNLMSSISTAAFLVDANGTLAFYNDAAASLLGRRFEEVGRMEMEVWGAAFRPVDESGASIAPENLPVGRALAKGRPAHARLRIRSLDDSEREIEVSALPIVAAEGVRGAIAIFWEPDEAG